MGKFKNLLIEKEDEKMGTSIPRAEKPETKVKDDGWESYKKEEQLDVEMEEEDV